jgi:hypothetical protein
MFLIIVIHYQLHLCEESQIFNNEILKKGEWIMKTSVFYDDHILV